jgi:hypothetical protein
MLRGSVAQALGARRSALSMTSKEACAAYRYIVVEATDAGLHVDAIYMRTAANRSVRA